MTVLRVALAVAALLLAAPAGATGISVDEMPPEMRVAYIVGIQEELAAHGYQPGPADGIVGRRTKAAIRRYQRDAGVAVDGIATKELLDHLKFVLPKVYAGTTPKVTAEPNGLVFEAQAELARRGYYQGPLDGLMGPQTRAAVQAFQRDSGLAMTGGVDAALLEQLRRY